MIESSITTEEFDLFQALIAHRAGIRLNDSKRALLVGRLSRRVRDLGLRTFRDYYARVLRDHDERTRMLDLITVTVKPSSFFSSVTVAVVATRAGGVPAVVSCAESAIEKQPACAAAISSSGLVPFPFSNRVPNEYCALLSNPLSVEITPFPSLRLPFHSAEALRFIVHTPFSSN